MVKQECLSTGQQITAILEWQNDDNWHPLTCASDVCDGDLEPLVEDGEVVLVCPECTYKQDWIPNVIFRSFIQRRNGK